MFEHQIDNVVVWIRLGDETRVDGGDLGQGLKRWDRLCELWIAFDKGKDGRDLPQVAHDRSHESLFVDRAIATKRVWRIDRSDSAESKQTEEGKRERGKEGKKVKRVNMTKVKIMNLP